MHEICPTVTAYDIDTYVRQLELVSRIASRIHIDLMDGELAPTMSPEITQLSFPDDKKIDIHVMYKNPALIADQLVAARPNMVILHAESNADIPKLASYFREYGIKTGLALLPGTMPASVNYLLPHVQHVLLFGGHLGYHGGEADLSQLEKIAELHTLHKPLEIGWDGGANLSNIGTLIEAGVNIVNVGSAIHKSDNPETTYATMKAKVTSV